MRIKHSKNYVCRKTNASDITQLVNNAKRKENVEMLMQYLEVLTSYSENEHFKLSANFV